MKNAKLFGKLSVIDLIVILLIVVLLIGVGVRFISFSGQDAGDVPAAPEAKSVLCAVTLRFEEIPAAIRRDPFEVGEIVTMGGKRFGRIAEFSKDFSRVEAKMDDGTTVNVASADEYTYLVTVEVTLEQNANGLLCSKSGTAIGVGLQTSFATRLFSHKGTVVRVEKTQ